MKLLAIITSVVLLSGCAITNETTLVTGAKRPPVSVDQVKLYTKAPTKYEEIAIVTADAKHDFMSKQALLDKTVEGIKAEAAKVGANGVLLTGMGDTNIGSTGVVIAQPMGRRGGMATGSTNNRTGKAIQGRAIFVTEE